MPRLLPGLRWDDDKQRYFPRVHSALPASPLQPGPDEHPRSSTGPYRTLERLRSVYRTAPKDALAHQIQSSQWSLTDEIVRSTIPLQGLVSAFQTLSHNGRVWSFAGDSLGWFYSSVADPHQASSWQPQYHLSSEVSSITLSPTTCVATTFGPECRILYLPLDSSVEGTHISRIDTRTVHDIWTADLHGSRLVLGANKQAVVIEDIAVSTSLQRLPTQSDVFALAQRENVLYTGLRNGGIVRFDTRLQRSQDHFFHGISQRKSSITGLKHIHGHQLLVSFLDGGISTFDLRFPVRTPLMNFTGNFNSYTTKLPLAIDPHEKFMFAAGQDNKIRLWSLTTGGPAIGTGSTHQSAFERPFEHRIAALQVVEEKEGMRLWAASGTELCKYSLGSRSRIGI